MIDRDSLDENNVMSVCNTYVTIPSKTQCFQRLELLQALIETIQEIRSGLFNTEYSNISKSRKKEKTLGLYRGFSFCYKKTPRLTWGSVNAMHLHIIIPSLTIELRSANCKQSKGGINYGSQ